MRLKRDENIAASARHRLAAIGLDVDAVIDEGLRGKPDADVWAATQAAQRFFVTQDLDFSDARKFAPGSHGGLLLVRLPDAEQWRVADWLVAWFASPEARSWEGCFVIATTTKVRVLRPPSPERVR